ncbi:polysaccharide export protein [Sphingomonas sp. BN140010]|uniref:Polysaccharide export protein n=1 Tax=Sphingomonas arvum TaxID=2992113 RepID=A0ABT3JD38_9SPHN|nr:polysaccharide biosynthesis/export family protein [Sphingomonas sp. BN140010]MCW3796982.1 polysaccharide export protein [Sphingomonas sp. BN140010]
MRKPLLVALPLMISAVTGCASNHVGANLPSGSMAYAVVPPAAATITVEDYRIGPLDALDITVLQEPDLSIKAAPVDAAGNVNLAMIGDVKAGGKTANEFAREVAQRYSQRYLRNPQVSVVVAKPVAQKVAVQGEVVQPGVYPIEGPTTLLGALSLAKGETQYAALNDVAVFRTVGGRRAGAVFNVAQIRSGQLPDPQIQSNDMIIVGYSGSRRAWRDIVNSMPLLNILRPF